MSVTKRVDSNLFKFLMAHVDKYIPGEGMDNYEYCLTVIRTFLQDCSFKELTLPGMFKSVKVQTEDSESTYFVRLSTVTQSQ